MLVGDTIKHRNLMEDLTGSFAAATANGSFQPGPGNIRLFSNARIRDPEILRILAGQD
jgi:hypothetical protein